jgi:hypothetical protein
MKPDQAPSMVRMLESVVILGWSDLMKDAKSGVLHLEYAFRIRQLLGVPQALVVHSPGPLASRVRILDVSFRVTWQRHLLRGWLSV